MEEEEEEDSQSPHVLGLDVQLEALCVLTCPDEAPPRGRPELITSSYHTAPTSRVAAWTRLASKFLSLCIGTHIVRAYRIV